MPILKASKKDMKRINARTEVNRAKRSKIRTLKKAVVSAETKEEATQNLKTASSALDKAVKINLMHRKTASRVKSRLAKKVNALS